MESCSFSNLKGDVCECSGNNISTVNVRGYSQVRANLRRINRDEISDEMDRIVELLKVRTECRYRYAQKIAPTHFNLVPSFPGYEIAELLIFV